MKYMSVEWLFTATQPTLITGRIEMLNIISEEQTVFGAAISYWDQEFATVGINKNKRDSRFTESIEVRRMISSTENVSYRDTHIIIK